MILQIKGLNQRFSVGSMRLFDFIYASKLLLFAAAEGWGRRLLKW
jgi:hypothetical protein